MNFECSLREHAARQLRTQRSVNDDGEKCERVDPAMSRMVHEKFEMAESYLGRFIANILRKFTNKKDVEGVRARRIYCLLNAITIFLIKTPE